MSQYDSAEGSPFVNLNIPPFFTVPMLSTRDLLRMKVNKILTLFDANQFERSIALSRFEAGLSKASDEKLREALRVLRE